MMGMMGKMKDVQAKLKTAQEQLVHLRAEGEAGAGMVKATVNGHRKLVKVEIDPDLVKPEDREMLQDLTVAAVNKAMEDIEGQIKEEMQKATAGSMPNIPGLDLSSFTG